jgi:hypothetical protein
MKLRRIFSTILVLGFAAAMAWAGGDPWKSKPFQQWDEKDVKKVLNDSPWSRIVSVPAPWASGDSEGGPGPALANASQDHSPDGGIMGTAGAGKPPAAPTVKEAQFIVRWASSRVVREAALRGAVLGGHLKQEEADKQAAQPLEIYQVLIAGPDMKPFQAADDKAFLEKTFLVLKKSKQRIPAASIEYQRGPDGKTVQAVAFSFPKKAASGEPTIPADEKSVEIFCSVGGANIRVSFEIPKMEDSQGRDL